jgi:hypothetical protein
MMSLCDLKSGRLMMSLCDLKSGSRLPQYPSGPVWLDSLRGVPRLSSTLMLYVPATDPIECTAVQKCLSVCALRQTCSCIVCIATAVL